MFNFLREKLPFMGMVLLCATATAQAQGICSGNNLAVCDITVTPPPATTLFCGVNLAADLKFVLTNNTPANKTFDYDVLLGLDALGLVEIDAALTLASCGGTVAADLESGTATLAAGASCTVTLDVKAHTVIDCVPGELLDVALSINGIVGQAPIIIALDVTEEVAPTAITGGLIPSLPTCTAGAKPFCAATIFCAFGGVSVHNTNLTADTTLTACDTGSPLNILGDTITYITSGSSLVGTLLTTNAETDITNLLSFAETTLVPYCNSPQGYNIPVGDSLGNAGNLPILPKGVYCFNDLYSAAELNGQVTLYGAAATDIFIILVPSSLEVNFDATGSPTGISVLLSGAAQAKNVFWVVFDTSVYAASINPGLGTLAVPGSFLGNVYSVGGIRVGDYVDLTAGARLLSAKASLYLNADLIDLP